MGGGSRGAAGVLYLIHKKEKRSACFCEVFINKNRRFFAFWNKNSIMHKKANNRKKNQSKIYAEWQKINKISEKTEVTMEFLTYNIVCIA